ncbi:Protein of unknown function [Pyronema omphalodes CBS 100304]|uniref:Uncharacterized protein n=1 Tax=Pyronema omphalodes (strain CBS 100304) TaxID=1076935 RepID=U4L0I8_PYROM|nr:Protein of unknown function [Pyronema omphalodes CBS 100304]
MAKSLCVTVSGINVYVNPTATATNNNSHNAFGEKNIYVNPVAAQTLQNEEQVIAAWVEPCFSGLSLRSSRYNDGECFLSFRLLAQAMLMASKLTKDVSADSTATTAKYCQYNGEWKILYIFAGVQGWDCNKTKPKEIKITGTKNDVRNMIESIFGAQGCRQDELEFQTVDGMLDVWARPDMERLNRGDLMVALAMPHIENGEVQNGIE